MKYVVFLMLCLLLAACGDTTVNSTTAETGAKSGFITAKLQFFDHAKSSQKVVESAPANVATIQIAVSGPNMVTMQQNFAASGGLKSNGTKTYDKDLTYCFPQLGAFSFV